VQFERLADARTKQKTAFCIKSIALSARRAPTTSTQN
jgi:hypothetical protein